MEEIFLSTETVAGTDRGGEDLFLAVRAFSGKKEPRLTAAAFEAAWSACVKRLPTSGDAAEEAGEGEQVWTEGGKLRSLPTDHYEFGLDWPLDKAKEEVRRIFMDGEWVKSLKTGMHSVDERVYVDGNAD